MTTRILKRVLNAVLLAFGVATIAFVVLHILPGDPTTALISPRLSPSTIEQIRVQYGLDQSLPVQYGLWLWSLVRGDFGFSFSQQRDVLDILANALPYTIILALTAILIELILGSLVALLAVRRLNGIVDKALSIGGLATYTLPSFWTAILLVSVFSYGLGLLPSAQVHSIGAEQLPPILYALDFVEHLILPALAIGLPGAAGIARFLRANLLEVYKREYVLAAYSLGVSESRVFLSYALPNALLPVVTILGLELGVLISGALVVETVFAWPGMGRLTVTAIFARDYPLVLACTMVSSLAVIGGNLVADLLSSILDPRLRKGV